MNDPITDSRRNIADRTGRTDWFDLPVSDLADAMSFYEGLLGWDYLQMEDSPLTDYVMIQVRGTLIGGMRRVPPRDRTDGPAHRAGKRSPSKIPEFIVPVLYFTVEELDPKIARAKELGAEIVGEPVSLGRERGRYQWIRDREGNLIALWAPR